MDFSHALVLLVRQSPNSVDALEKTRKLHTSRTGTSGLPWAVPRAQLFLHGGWISE